jgi:putative FmdB family regulatory protein
MRDIAFMSQTGRLVKTSNKSNPFITLIERNINVPIYEYRCEKCQTIFERLTFKADEEKLQCPECGKTEVARVLSAASFTSTSGLGACAPGSTSGFS